MSGTLSERVPTVNTKSTFRPKPPTAGVTGLICHGVALIVAVAAYVPESIVPVVSLLLPAACAVGDVAPISAGNAVPVSSRIAAPSTG